jgi:hypothetical protein
VDTQVRNPPRRPRQRHRGPTGATHLEGAAPSAALALAALAAAPLGGEARGAACSPPGSPARLPRPAALSSLSAARACARAFPCRCLSTVMGHLSHGGPFSPSSPALHHHPSRCAKALHSAFFLLPRCNVDADVQLQTLAPQALEPRHHTCAGLGLVRGAWAPPAGRALGRIQVVKVHWSRWPAQH